MSIIQKLENSYLEILRIAVIASSSLLLIAALGLAGWSIKSILPAPEAKPEAVLIDSRDVLQQVAPEEDKVAQAGEHPASGDAASKLNPAQQIESEKIYAMAAAFIGKFNGNVQTINKNGFIEYLEAKLNRYETDEIKAQYLHGLASVMDSSFKSLRVNAIAGSPMAAAAPEQSGEAGGNEQVIPQVNDKPINMVGSIINSYTALFNKKIASAKAVQEARNLQLQNEKAAATMRLYGAAGLFGLFLLVVFLSIVIKIERNLREIADKRMNEI